MFDRWFDSSRWWLGALSGLLLVAGFAPFSCATAGWIALVPAWWTISRSERAQRQPIRHGWVLGLIYFGGVFWWISNVTSVGTFFLVLYLALYPAVWFVLVARLIFGGGPEARPSSLIQAPAAAALWVMLEWWRSWFLTGFNWDELGITQAPSSIFRQLAAYGGVHLLSFVLVTVNILWAEGVLALVETAREKRVVRPSLAFATALVIVAACFALGWRHLQRHRGETPGPELSFACVQPNIPQIPYDGGSYTVFMRKQDEALDAMKKLSLQAIVARPQLLIWPEAVIDEGIFQDRPMNEAVHEICTSFDGCFLLGSSDYVFGTTGKQGQPGTPARLYNCAYLFSPDFEVYQYYQKTRLVILGEFLPFGDRFPWVRKLIGVGMDFTPGNRPKKFMMQVPPVSFAPLICFEDTLPEVANKAVRLKPDFFITITNDGWYRGWWATWGVRQHLNHAIFRCIEHDRSMVRCANTGISCVIDPNGTVTSRYADATGRDIDVGGIFTGHLACVPAQTTLYERWGDWIVLISSLISLMLGVRFFSRLFAP